MGLIMTENKKEREPIPEGVYQGVTTGIIDLGTHYNPVYEKTNRKILIMWEIPELTITFKRDDHEVTAPRVISKQYTASWNEKATLRKDIQSWRGSVLSGADAVSFDIFNMIGKNCMLQIINHASGDKTYSKIASILPLYKGIPEVAPTMDTITYSIEDGNNIPENMPKWIKEVILKSQEFAS